MNKKFVLQKPEKDKYKDRPCPEWFRDAKLGVFLHWGPYAVPGWAPITEKNMFSIISDYVNKGSDVDSVNWVSDIMREIVGELMAQGKTEEIGALFSDIKGTNPYSEWYWNSMYTTEATKKYHKETYGDKPYTDFGPEFAEACKNWDANSWAELFSEIGAKYVLTTAKHHDGYCLYPSKYKNPKIANWQTERDLMGDLDVALKKKGLRNCLYYSASYDFAISGVPIDTSDNGKFFMNSPQDLEYVDNQVIEIIERYKPSVLWEDIGYSENGNFERILDAYYSAVPDGLVNDRAQVGLTSDTTRHFDFTTTEYFVPHTIRETPWETCRGIGDSFGYNRMDTEETLLSAQELVESWADIVSKNGNMMLGLGPMADGTIPEIQQKVVKEFGEWVNKYGHTIFGSRPYTYHADKLKSGNEVRFVTKDGVLNIIILGNVSGEIEFENLKIKDGAKVTMATGEVITESYNGKLMIDKVYDEKAVVLSVNIKEAELK